MLLLSLAGGLVSPAPALAQTAPVGAAAPAPETTPPPATPDPVAALDGILATLRNDTSRAAFVADLEKLRSSLAARGAAASGGTEPAATPPDAAGTTTTTGKADADAKPAEEVPPEGGLLGAVAVGLTDVGKTVREQVTDGSIPARISAAAGQAETRLSNAFTSGNALGFLLWASTGWGLGLVLLYGLRMLPWLRPLPQGARFRADRRQRLWRNAGLDAARRLVPWVPAAVLMLAWPAILPRSGDSARLFLAVAVPFLVGSLVLRLGGPLLFLLGPLRGWHMVAYAERRIMPWIGALATLSVTSTMLRAPELRWTLGWDVAAVLTFLIDLTLGVVAVLFILYRRRGVQRLLSRRQTAHAEEKTKLHKLIVERLAANWHLLGLLIVGGHLISRLIGVGGGSFIGRAMLTVGALVVISAIAYAVSGGLARLAGCCTTARAACPGGWSGATSGWRGRRCACSPRC
ncbi:hypothetical protein ACFQU7_09600 [Pseudoroseomonas wenyumeiae]